MIQFKMTVPSGVAIPLALTLDVLSIVNVSDFDFFKSFTGEAVADAAFTKTLALGPLTFIDPSTGLALSKSDFSLVSDFGYDYLHPAAVSEPSAVPEPPIYGLRRADCWRCGWRQQTSRAFACFLEIACELSFNRMFAPVGLPIPAAVRVA